MPEEGALVSIIIPNYNRGDLLQETLDSLRHQDYSNWEAIIVDDGSTDNSRKIVEDNLKNNSRFRFVPRDREPRGAPTCRNIGLNVARGEYVIFLDSDDLLTPFSLSQRVQTIRENPGFDFWVFPILMFRDNPANARFLWNIDDGKDDLYRFLILDAPWQTTGPIWRKSAAEKIGGFTEGLACWQDVDFHLKALISGLKGKKFYELKPDVMYRQHETQSISQGEISSPAKLDSRANIFRTHTLNLKPYFQSSDPEMNMIKSGLRILGGNVVIGTAKMLKPVQSCKLIIFGLKSGVFGFYTTMKLYCLTMFFLFRMNKIGFLDTIIQGMIRQFRKDSSIGIHSYKQPTS